MKKLIDLSETELINFIQKRYRFVDVQEDAAECAVCGTTEDAKYYYCCDDCSKFFDKGE